MVAALATAAMADLVVPVRGMRAHNWGPDVAAVLGCVLPMRRAGC